MSLCLSLVLAVSVALAPAAQAILPSGSAYDHFKIGMQALATEQHAKAEAEFKNAVAIDPLYDAAFYGLGQVYMATKRYDDAIRAYLDSREAFNAAIAADKFDATKVDRRIRDRIQALQDYGRTLQRGSTTASPTLYAAIERNKEEVRQAEAMLNRSHSGAPPLPPPGLALALGSAYFRVGDLKSAEREYLTALASNPSFGEAHSNLAVVYMVTGRLDLADQEIALAEKAGFNVNPRLKDDLKSRRAK